MNRLTAQQTSITASITHLYKTNFIETPLHNKEKLYR